MISKIIVVLNVIFTFHMCLVKSEGDLVFVIDDTGSMGNDIAQVKTEVDKLFDAAFTSNSSAVEEFLIVTFNDPDVQLRTKTKDRTIFKKALNDIEVNGGDDCPEMALTGLELALNESRPNSLVYLFTDADAKDFQKINSVKVMAKEKKDKLIFLLTGNCYDAEGNRTYLDLAEATGGQVFNLFKEEVGQMLEHARVVLSDGFASTIRTMAVAEPVVASAGSSAFASLDSASRYEATNFAVDESTKDVLVTVSGTNPEVRLAGPEGVTPKTESIARTSGSVVLKIVDAKPGTYTVTVKSEGPSSVVVNNNKKQESLA